MIRTERLTVTLGDKTALRNVSLQFKRGRVTVLLGPNGAGKSTLMRGLAGVLPSDSVFLDDGLLSKHSLQERARRIGYLPQNGEPAWNISVRELVALGRLPHRTRFAAVSDLDQQVIDAALIETDTMHLADRTVGTLSGGELARVKLARLFAGQPDWLLADEPLANLDPAHQRDMLQLLRRSATNGKGVVIVLHQLDAALHIADDVVLLKNGDLLASGDAKTCMTKDNLERLFQTGFDLTKHGDLLSLSPNWSRTPNVA